MAPKNNKKQKLSDSESASASSSESDSDNSSPPRKDAKTKSKSETGSQSKKSSSESSSKEKSTKSLRVTGESEPTWELGSKKFVTIGDFKGKTYVNIREYYEKDGKVLPGKKGIGLNVEQWQNLCSCIDEVNKVLKK